MNNPTFFDQQQFEQFLADCCNQYEQTDPTVHAFCDGLYDRLADNQPILLREVTGIMPLLENGIWEHPNFAANRIYHLQSELGQDTAGHTGY